MKAEKEIQKSALRAVQQTNSNLVGAYEASLERVKTELLKTQVDLLRGGVVSEFRQERLQTLYRAINEELEVLRRQTISQIQGGYVRVYQSTYYQQAFAIEQFVNTQLNLSRDYILNFPAINTNAVRESFNEIVAGNTFTQRATYLRDELRFRVREAVAGNIIEGQTVQQLAKNLRILDDVYDMGIARVNTMARTELLTAYSLGQDEATREAQEAGVEFNYTWSASFTKNTRPTHVRADGQKALIIENEPVFTVGGVKFKSPRIVSRFNTNTKNIKREKINCRCFRENNPFGIRPTVRVAQRQSGEWIEINGDVTAAEWAEREYGVKIAV